MCGIIGCQIKNPQHEDFTRVGRVFRNLAVRGMHATGISFIRDGKVVTVSEPINANQFLDKFDLELCVNDDVLTFIGHTRYSTSDLKFNQPIGNDNVAIAHNGVITQAPPHLWGEMFDLEYDGNGNDSSLILRCREMGIEPLHHFPECSAAVVELNADGTLIAYRNGHRPLWWTNPHPSKGVIFASSQQTLERVGFCSKQTQSYVKYDCLGGIKTHKKLIGYGEIPKDKQFNFSLPPKFEAEAKFDRP